MQIFHSTATALVILIAVAACSAPGSGTSAGPGEPVSVDASVLLEASSLPSDPAGEAGRLATDAYRGMWLSFAEAATTSDWQSPKLGEFATGTALNTLTRGLYGDRYKGVVSRGRPVLNPAVSSSEPVGAPTRIIVTDCGDSTNWTRHYADSGQPADDEPGGRRHIDAIVEEQADGTWKVVEFGVQEVGTC
ncbi:hypothetical protein [Saccharothrix sp. NRRL B-16348]|uniref:hypothetical protein n=1 Tax=Saccharothrix sp. NRRL B-16348 TaxID=1415542 RepID=UPI001E3111DE|nr:hypothetical protein [Saccharothrix sp. NRRL B-16348]